MREIIEMPTFTVVARVSDNILRIADIRGQITPAIDLPGLTGRTPRRKPLIFLATEFPRTAHGFAVKEGDGIVRLEWDQVLSAKGRSSGKT